MGRWAQQRRRGGGGLAAAHAVTLNRVDTIDGNSVILHFSAAIEVDNSVPFPDGTLIIDGNDVEGVAAPAGNSVLVALSDVPLAGGAWNVAGQPAWLLTTLVIPEAGIVQP